MESGIKICQIKYVELPAVVTPVVTQGVSKVTFISGFTLNFLTLIIITVMFEGSHITIETLLETDRRAPESETCFPDKNSLQR